MGRLVSGPPQRGVTGKLGVCDILVGIVIIVLIPVSIPLRMLAILGRGGRNHWRDGRYDGIED